MRQNININYNMEELNKLIADPIFVDFLNGIEYPGYLVKWHGPAFVVILN